ncbi:MAG: aminotransferase class V-fold PLP-dependent enzyme [Flavobacteriaceae bacterium]
MTDQNRIPFRAAQKIIAELLEEYIKSSKALQGKVLDQKNPLEIAQELDLKKHFTKGFQTITELESFIKKYLKHTNHLRNPRYMGHQVAVPQDLSGIPDWIHGTINNPSSLYEMGPVGATLEGFMIHWMLDQLGWFKGTDYYDFKKHPENGSGILTHGGSMANMTALSAARAAIAPEAWTEGTPKDLVVMGPSTSHYSVVRSMSIMGMGKNAFVPVPVDKNEVIQIEALDSVYSKIKKEGKRVMAVVANACATSTGLYDPLESMAAFCKKYQLWFHVDGAHGAVALLSEKDQYKVKGIEQADSLIWDAHKMLRVPSLCTAVLFKRQQDQWNNFHQKGSYVFHENEVVGMDSMPFTIECTKSALGTKLFWSFALEGEQALSDFVSDSFQQTQDLYQFLTQQSDFYCPYVPQSNILCFQYLPELLTDDQQLELRYAVINSGEFYITSCMLNNKRFLRTVLINPLTRLDDFKALTDSIKKQANRLFLV